MPFTPPGDLPDPGIEPTTFASPALAGGFFTAKPPGKSLVLSSTELQCTRLVGFMAYHLLSLFFKTNLFNWRLITLQYRGGFCHTLT